MMQRQDPRQRPPAGPAAPPMIRQVNQGMVLQALRDSEPLRLGELARLTGISRPTVGAVVDELSRAGWVEYAEEDASAGTGMGRPARVVRFRSDAGYVVGIDVGRHRATVALSDLDGTIVATARRSTTGDTNRHELMTKIRTVVHDALAAAGVSRDTVLSVVVGSPGSVDTGSGTVNSAPGLPGWAGVNLVGELRRSFHCPVHVENDVNLAVIGERWKGTARDSQSAVFVLWGERVGAGLFLDGRLYRGAHHSAGEIGYLTLRRDGTSAADASGRGPFEARVGASAIVDLAREAAVRGGRLATLADEGTLDAASVFQAASEGDQHAIEVVDIAIARLARGLGALLLVTDPDVLVIGGGLSRAGAFVLDIVKRHLEPLMLRQTSIMLSNLGDNAVVTGALKMALADVERRLMPQVAPFTTDGF